MHKFFHMLFISIFSTIVILISVIEDKIDHTQLYSCLDVIQIE